jgi:uncharacterized membrane protein YebE (DUF533 family)
MNPDFLINGVLSSVMGGGRRKRSKKALRYLTRGQGSFWTHPTTLMTAAGLAWGVFDTLKNQAPGEGQWGGGTAPVSPQPQPAASSAATVPLPPLPDIGGAPAPAIDEEELRLVRLAISAANADGVMSDEERAAVLEQAQASGVGEVVEHELQQRRPLGEIVSGVADPAQRATMYVLAFTILRADEHVTGAERIFLAQLAHLLGLDPATVQRLENDTSERIDSAGTQGDSAGSSSV